MSVESLLVTNWRRQDAKAHFYGRAGIKAISAAVIACVSAGTAVAQTSSLMLEEVIVTARKIEENLQQTPVAVTAMTGDDMSLRGVENVVDIGSYAPNVNLSSGASFSGASSAPSIFIRGIGQSDFVNTADPAVGVYVDGVYTGRSVGGLMDVVDLERVEVLRGPQGTLFGRNNIGGAISLITKKPDPDAGFSGKLAFTIGEDEHYEGQLSANIPISPTVAARVSGLYRTRDGYVKATQYDDLMLGDDDSLTLRGQLQFLPTDNLTIGMAIDYTTEKESPSATVATFIGDLPSFPGNPPDGTAFNASTPGCDTPEAVATSLTCYGPAHVSSNGFTNNSLWTDKNGNRVKLKQEMDLFGASLSLQWDIGVGEIKSITAYRDLESNFFNDLDFTPFPLFHNENARFDQDQFTQELQFSGNFLDDRLSLVTGLYYFEESSQQDVGINRIVGPGSPGGGFFQDSLRTVDNESKAVFGQATYDINDILHLTVGLRYTKETKDFELSIDRLTNNGTFLGPIFGDMETKETTPLVTLGWDISETIYGYVTYSEGFRSGGFPTRFTGGFPSEIPFFDPEYVEAVEVGLKMDLLDGRLRLNLSAFETSYNDIQIAATSVVTDEANTAIENLGAAEFRGIEGELLFVITDNFRIDLNVGWLDDEVTEVEGGELLSGGISITTANDLPYTPELNGTMGANYVLPLDSGADFHARIDVRYVDEQYFKIENVPEAYESSYTTSNLSLSYISADNWEVNLGVRNLTDSDHHINATFSPLVGTAQAVVVRPRSTYLTFRYHWGE